MRAETTIKAVESIAKVSRKGKRINGLFRLLGNPEVLWKQADINLYTNKGAVTKDTTSNTLDGFSMDRVNHLIRLLYAKEYHFKPVRRTCIPKKNGKWRPLGIPTGDDKLVQEVVRILLEQIYEPVFLRNSHGFRPQKSCHTALMQAKNQWNGVKWIIEFDIKGFFDNIDHQNLLKILEKKIDDKRIITLVHLMLKAGYVQDWKWNPTHSGTPQGGVISPILANVYLHKLDMFMENMINTFHKGNQRASNPEYVVLKSRLESTRGMIHLKKQGKKGYKPYFTLDDLYQQTQSLRAQMRTIHAKDQFDTD